MVYKIKQAKETTEDVYYFSKGHQLWKLYRCKVSPETKKMIEDFDKVFTKSQRVGTYQDYKDKIQIAFLRHDQVEARRLLQIAIEVETKCFI
jgi:hypothetical protein